MILQVRFAVKNYQCFLDASVNPEPAAWTKKEKLDDDDLPTNVDIWRLIVCMTYDTVI